MCALLLLAALATQESGRTVDLEPPRVLDLIFTVTDIGGAVQDLQVKEIGDEVRIDLNVDVLSDFDKSDVLPNADETLAKAASIVKERSKGTVMIGGHTDSKGGDAY